MNNEEEERQKMLAKRKLYREANREEILAKKKEFIEKFFYKLCI